MSSDNWRVDAWDEDEDDEDDGWAAAPKSRPAEAVGKAGAEEEEPPTPSLRERLRGAPIWRGVIRGGVELGA